METQSHLPQTNNKTFHSFLSVLSVYHSSQTQFRWEQKQTRICLSCQHCHWRTHSLHVLVWLQTRCVVNSLCSSFADVCCELSVFLFCWRVLWTLCVLALLTCIVNSLCFALLTIFVSSRQKNQRNFPEIHLPVYVLVVDYYWFGVVGASLLLFFPLLSSCHGTLDPGASSCSGRYVGLMADW